MKTAYLGAIVLLSAFVLPTATRGQFLKTLVNNTKNTIAGKSTASAVSSSGKKDSGTVSGMTPADSIALVQRLAQLQKPEPGISPADSAAAIQQFKTASGGAGQYYQFLDTYTIQKNKKDSVFRDTMSLAITDGHNTRVEFSVFGGRTEVLGHAGMPRFSMMLDQQAKTYRLHIIDTAAINKGGGMSYQAVKVGTETVQGYSCIHARMTMSTPGSKMVITEDIWTSNDVPGYAALKKLELIQNVTPAMIKALEQAGCDGFIVKVIMHSTTYSLDMVLVQAIRKDFPATLFEVPAGYTAAANTNVLGRRFQK
jgi:hypothetical protein